MQPKSDKNKRRDSKNRYKRYPYANKKWYRTYRNRQLRRTTPQDEIPVYKKCILWDIW